MTEGDDIAQEIVMLTDLNRLLREGLVALDQDTEILGGDDADAIRFRPTPRGRAVSQQPAVSEEEDTSWISMR